MGLALEITEGPLSGRVFPLREGYILGRAAGEIRVPDDSRISSTHAKVCADPRGGLLLVDEGSSNGLQINGVTVRRVKLLPGVQFLAGKTRFRVLEAEHLELPPPAEEVKSWKVQLKASLEGLLDNAKPLAAEAGFSPFSPLIQLLFLEGVQTDQEILLGFGPRSFGSDTLDIDLHDPLSPPIAFTLTPSPDGPVFQTPYPKLVRLNKLVVASSTLKSGDLISVGQSLIEVRFPA